jgi:hypothetical protein
VAQVAGLPDEGGAAFPLGLRGSSREDLAEAEAAIGDLVGAELLERRDGARDRPRAGRALSLENGLSRAAGRV